MNSDRIKSIVRRLSRKHNTRDPFILADAFGILTVTEPLGALNGYYTKKYRIKIIHINSSLSESEQRFACAHELGHALLHPDANTPFLTKYTYLSVDKYEIEANKFALELLVPDELLLEYQDCTIDQVARATGYQKNLIELRMKGYTCTGE